MNKKHLSMQLVDKPTSDFINFYHTIKPHKGLNSVTPYEIPEFYFS
jgi:hypothetical protein